jgi:DNA (cytosine-5)-methyltransferase 1
VTAFYNEIDPYAAQWLRNLIEAGHIAPGVVDERSIEDINPDELRQYTQCHFFAGIGVWSYALRLAGWPDDRPVWTGSCPCQPFSAAGKGKGFADERHLWPAFHHLISECRPPVVFGEQVASKDGLGWLDVVQTDLEGTGYACGAADLCAAGVGAPHKRQRLFFVAERISHAYRGQDDDAICADCQHPVWGGCKCYFGEMRCSDCGEWTYPFHYDLPNDGCQWCGSSSLVYSFSERGRGGVVAREHARNDVPSSPWMDSRIVRTLGGRLRLAPRINSPLANGAAARVGRLRAYGNAIVPQVAQAFIESYLGH